MLVPTDFPGLSQWYEEALREAEVPETLIERMPAKEYLETMDRTERSHFTTSLMAMFSGSGSVRPSILVESTVSPRIISVAYDEENDRAKPIVDYIFEKREELISNHAFLPFLMYQGAASNLSMEFEI